MQVSEKFALHEETPRREQPRHRHLFDARNHYPQIKHHTPPPKRGNNKNPQPPEQTQEAKSRHLPPTQQTRGLVVSKPNSVSGSFSKQRFPHHFSLFVVHQTPPTTGKGFLTAHTPPMGVFLVVLLRKEVIQPHLPVRLPCYDLARIASSTLGAPLPCGLGTRLRIYPAFLA